MSNYCAHGYKGNYPNPDCISCSLCNYGRDCRNNPVPVEETEPTTLDKAIEIYAAGGGFCGANTIASVLKDMGDALVEQLEDNPEAMGLAMLAVARAYHKGRASHGGVELKDDCVWLPWGGGQRPEGDKERGQLVPVAALRSIKISESNGRTIYTMDYAE